VAEAMLITSDTNDLRTQILTKKDIFYKEVDVPEWGMKVWVRSLTSREKDAYEETLMVRKGKGKKKRIEVDTDIMRAKLVVRCACMGENDPRPIFELSDATELGGKSSAAIERLHDACHELSWPNAEDETEKNE